MGSCHIQCLVHLLLLLHLEHRSDDRVTLRQELKLHGFFGLSSVGDTLGNVPWGRLGTYRSGGGKAQKRAHPYMPLVPGRCHARTWIRASCKGKHGPQLAVGILEPWYTRLFRGSIRGNTPTRVEAFPGAIVSYTTLPKPVEWLPVASLCQIADTVGNAVTFLHSTLRAATHTLFSWQGTTHLFLQRCQKVETAWVTTVRETRLTTAIGNGVACGGFCSVKGNIATCPSCKKYFVSLNN